jgi:hypothetical protein
VIKKGGDGRPLSAGGDYRFLPPFFFPPLAVFFAIARIPPFVRGFRLRGAFTAVALPLPPGTSARLVGARRLSA